MEKLILVIVFTNFVFNLKAQNSKPNIITFTTQQDHDNMKQQLGIKALRPGPSGNEAAPNRANYNENTANPCPILPEILISNSGKKIKTVEQWTAARKPELFEEFEKNIYGRQPNNIPKVSWKIKIIDREIVNRIPVLAKEIIGIVDNTACPEISVEIKMMLVVPTNIKGPVPVLMMFGRPSFPAPTQPNNEDLEKINEAFKQSMVNSNPELKAIFEKYPAYQPITRLTPPNFFTPPKPENEYTPQEQLLAAGWGYCTLDPASIQADNGAPD